MPQSQPNNRVSLSYSTISVIGAILGIIIAVWQVGNKIATKADVDSIKAAITPTLTDHETRIRGVELQLASYFGASKTSTVRPTEFGTVSPIESRARFVLAQYQPPTTIPEANAPATQRQLPPIPQRRAVVPIELVKMYQLEPTRGGAYAVLGEDGRYYSLDDILYVIIQMHLAEKKTK